jgi:7-cyano-7-deazaguanine reductase
MPTRAPLPPDASPLGKSVTYAQHYSPELLFPIPRLGKRRELGLDAGPLPFVGEDTWNAYELSWLNARGKPVVAVARFVVPADSPYLIESKSLKLYLNSFNQTRLEDGSPQLHALLVRDLSAAAGAPVSVAIAPLADRPQRSAGYPQGVLLDDQDIAIERYTLDSSVLKADPAGAVVTETLYSHLLKSNCLVTGQPDWGMLVLHYSGAPIDREGLLRYLVSFRQHDEFHEQCVERIFTDVLRLCRPSSLCVWARYTRRGGLDINPCRRTPDRAAPQQCAEIRQ